MGRHRRWLNRLGLLLGVFPLVQHSATSRTKIEPRQCGYGYAGRAGGAAAAAAAAHGKPAPAPRSVDDLIGGFGSPFGWASDFSSKTRRTLKREPLLLRRSTGWLCYSMVLVSTSLAYTMYSSVDEFQRHSQQVEGEGRSSWSRRTDAYVSLCEYTSLCVATGVAACSSWLCRAGVIRHAELLNEVDTMLGLPTPRPQLWLAGWLALLLAVLVVDKTVWLMTDDENFIFAYDDLPLYLTYFTCFVAEALYMSDALEIHTRLAAINQIIVDASPRPGYRDALGTPVVLPGTLTVSRLASAHSLLGKAMDTVSQRYGVTLLVDMVALLLNLVITCYLFLEHMLPSSEPPEDYTRFSMEMVFAVLHFSRIVMLVEQPSAAAHEAVRTGTLVGYLGSTVPYGSMMHEQLKALSVQLTHQRGSFTNCGLFEMSRSIIVPIVGSVATYLLVLLQLKNPPSGRLQLGNATR